MYLRIRHACLLLVAFLAIDFGSAFVPGAAFQRITTTTTTTTATTTTRAFQSATRGTSLRRLWMTSTAAEDETTVNISDMRLSEIQSELKRLNVSSKDCFDRESLTARLLQARPLGKTQVTKEAVVDDNEAARASEPTATTRNPTSETTGSTQTNVKSTDTAANTKSTVAKDAELKQQLKEQVAALSVRELRQELAASGKRWAGMLEKRDLVQAVVDCRLATADFSVSGKMQPGQVADLTDQELTQELQSEQTLILLDVYATWYALGSYASYWSPVPFVNTYI